MHQCKRKRNKDESKKERNKKKDLLMHAKQMMHGFKALGGV